MSRIKLIERIVKLSQATVPTMNSASTVKTMEPPKTPPPATPPATPTPTPPKPTTPSKPEMTPATQPTPPPNAEGVHTTPVPGTEEEQTQATELHNIIKAAINDKKEILLKARYYYTRNTTKEQSLNLLHKKGVATSNIDGVILNTCVVNNMGSYLNMIENGAISIYEPVAPTTKSFRITFNNMENKNELFATMQLVANKLNKIGFDTVIVKSNNKYQIKCLSATEFDTNTLYSIASNIIAPLSNVDLSELKPGKLKVFYFSLDKFGNEDTIIFIEDPSKLG